MILCFSFTSRKGHRGRTRLSLTSERSLLLGHFPKHGFSSFLKTQHHYRRDGSTPNLRGHRLRQQFGERPRLKSCLEGTLEYRRSFSQRRSVKSFSGLQKGKSPALVTLKTGRQSLLMRVMNFGSSSASWAMRARQESAGSPRAQTTAASMANSTATFTSLRMTGLREMIWVAPVDT